MYVLVYFLINMAMMLPLCRHREADMTKERIGKLLKAGANVVLTTKGIDDMALKVSVCDLCF
jgi:T-complex protein 1 subunit alpha